jgi:hypothetical protein
MWRFLLISQNFFLPQSLLNGKYSNNFVSPQRRRVSVRTREILALLKPEVDPEEAAEYPGDMEDLTRNDHTYKLSPQGSMCGRNSVLWKCMAGYGPRPGMPGII